MKIKVKAYAKINLLLDILSTLPNGFHDLFMLMQSVDLYDLVTVETTDSGRIVLSCSEKSIPSDERNIAYKAAVAFFECTAIKNPGLEISIEKKIPHAAGLAGGSADGAAVIAALKKLFAPDLTDRQIIEIASLVGSDVPFCTTGGTMIAQGTGTILTYVPSLEIENIIIVKPDCSVSTGEAYMEFDNCENVIHTDRNGIFYACLNNDLYEICKKSANVFEQFIDVPQRVEIKSIMRSFNSKCSCMSGSGPSVFGIFDNKENAEKCLEVLKRKYPDTYLVSSVPFGCEIID